MELSLELEAGEVEPYPQKGSQRFFFLYGWKYETQI